MLKSGALQWWQAGVGARWQAAQVRLLKLKSLAEKDRKSWLGVLAHLMKLLVSLGEAQLSFWAIFVFPFPLSHMIVFWHISCCPWAREQYVHIYTFIKMGARGYLRCKKRICRKPLPEMFSSARRHRVSNILNDFLAPCGIWPNVIAANGMFIAWSTVLCVCSCYSRLLRVFNSAGSACMWNQFNAMPYFTQHDVVCWWNAYMYTNVGPPQRVPIISWECLLNLFIDKLFRRVVPGSVTKTQLNNMFAPQRVTVYMFFHSSMSISFQDIVVKI